MLFRFVSGKYLGGEYPLQSDDVIMVGRSSEFDMVLVDDLIAPRHARVIMQNGQCTIEPLSEMHPVYVNGSSIDGSVTLSPGDRVCLGKEIMVFEDGHTPRLDEVGHYDDPPRPMLGMAMPLDHDREGWLHTSHVPLPDIIALGAVRRRPQCFIEYALHRSVGIYLEYGIMHSVTFQDEPDPYIAFARILALDPGRWRIHDSWPRDSAEMLERMTPIDMPLETFMDEMITFLRQRAEAAQQEES